MKTRVRQCAACSNAGIVSVVVMISTIGTRPRLQKAFRRVILCERCFAFWNAISWGAISQHLTEAKNVLDLLQKQARQMDTGLPAFDMQRELRQWYRQKKAS